MRPFNPFRRAAARSIAATVASAEVKMTVINWFRATAFVRLRTLNDSATKPSFPGASQSFSPWRRVPKSALKLLLIVSNGKIQQRHSDAVERRFKRRVFISSQSGTQDTACTDLNSLCYNSVSGQGQLLWVGFACSAVLDGGLAWCPWCPLTSEFGSMGLNQANRLN